MSNVRGGGKRLREAVVSCQLDALGFDLGNILVSAYAEGKADLVSRVLSECGQ